MKKIILSVLVILAVSVASISATQALFTDEETSTGNTFTAGSLDLTVNGANAPLGVVFTSEELLPGSTKNAGTAAVTNSGTIPGKFTLMISNVVSNENSLLEPEIEDGDIDGQEIDPTGYDANSGDGELWDMLSLTLYIDKNNDGKMQWNEPVIVNAVHTDMTTGGGFRILLDQDLGTADTAHGFDGIINPGETVHVGLLVKFKDDSQLASQPQYNGLTNNMAMTDDVSFDLIFGLEQVN